MHPDAAAVVAHDACAEVLRAGGGLEEADALDGGDLEVGGIEAAALGGDDAEACDEGAAVGGGAAVRDGDALPAVCRPGEVDAGAGAALDAAAGPVGDAVDEGGAEAGDVAHGEVGDGRVGADDAVARRDDEAGDGYLVGAHGGGLGGQLREGGVGELSVDGDPLDGEVGDALDDDAGACGGADGEVAELEGVAADGGEGRDGLVCDGRREEGEPLDAGGLGGGSAGNEERGTALCDEDGGVTTQGDACRHGEAAREGAGREREGVAGLQRGELRDELLARQ